MQYLRHIYTKILTQNSSLTEEPVISFSKSSNPILAEKSSDLDFNRIPLVGGGAWTMGVGGGE